MNANCPKPDRDVLFISKGALDDDDFVVWFTPRLKAPGYRMFADILSLQPGDRWRSEIINICKADYQNAPARNGAAARRLRTR